MSTIQDQLKEAFAGESQANHKYLAYAKQAEIDGFANVARLFRTAAQAETLHAHGHFDALGGVGNTVENLKAAIEGETYEYTKMYPPMLAQAEKADHPARRMFGYAVKAEEVHAKLYTLALQAVKEGKDLDTAEIYLCPVCGHIEIGKPTQDCPICHAKANKYIKV